MSVRYYRNHYDGLPDTKVLLYHSTDLDPVSLESLDIFHTVIRQSQHVLITDSTIAETYLAQLTKCLGALHVQVHPVVVSPGERTKSLQTYLALIDRCTAFGLDRKSSVISFGGGVIKDLAGFLASTLFRGLNLVHIPTTVLAQVDAAIDCNQSINLPIGKNLVGTWYSPSEIWVNTAFLRSLDERWVRDGLGESIKIALCQSPDFLDLLGEAALSDAQWLARVVDMSISLKIGTLKRESQAEDAVKQYGHTVGHAVEHLSAGTIGHGEAIAIGMCASAEMALLAGLSDSTTLQKHYDIFQKLGLPSRIPDGQHPEQILAQVRFDKHFVRGEIYMPVLHRVGTFCQSGSEQVMIPFPEDLVFRSLEQNKKGCGVPEAQSKI